MADARVTYQGCECREYNQLISPVELVKEIPVSAAAEQTVLEGREQIRAVLRGDDSRMMMVVGPCSIHDEEIAVEYAGRLLKLREELSDRLLIVMRVYFEKPRTTVGWKGLIYDPHLNDTFEIDEGLRTARRLMQSLAEMGVYTGTEFLDPIVPQYLADLVCWSTIGARTTESQTHRQMASGLSMPVGFKNGTDGSAQIAVDAMISAKSAHAFLGIDHDGQTAVIHTSGNPDGHLVLRGGREGPNFGAESVAEAHRILGEAQVRSELLVDCSHGNSEQRPRATAHRLQGRRGTAGGRQRQHHRLHARVEPESRRPEAERRPRVAAVRSVDHRCLHRMGRDRRAPPLGTRPGGRQSASDGRLAAHTGMAFTQYTPDEKLQRPR